MVSEQPRPYKLQTSKVSTAVSFSGVGVAAWWMAEGSWHWVAAFIAATALAHFFERISVDVGVDRDALTGLLIVSDLTRHLRGRDAHHGEVADLAKYRLFLDC